MPRKRKGRRTDLIPKECVRKFDNADAVYLCAVMKHRDGRRLFHIVRGGAGTASDRILLERMMQQAQVAARRGTAAYRSQMRVARRKAHF